MAQETRTISFLLRFVKAGVFIILLLPLLIYEQSLFPFIFPRTIVFRLIVELMFGAYLVLWFSAPVYRVRKSTLIWLLSGFILVLVATSIFGVDPYHSFFSSIERSEGLLTLLHLLAFFFISLGVFKTRREWLQLFNVALLAFWLQTIYSLGQMFDWAFVLKTTGERVSGTLGNPSFFASYLVFVIFLAAYLLSQYRSRWVKGYYLSIIVSASILLWLTQNRGALMGLLSGWLIFALVMVFRRQVSVRIKAGFFIVLAMLAMLGAFVWVNKDAPWAHSFPTLYRLTHTSAADTTVRNRLIVWGAGYQAFLQRPFSGWGWENFNAAFNEHFDPAITRDIGSRPWYYLAPNTLVEIPVGAGIFGLLIYLASFAWLVKLLWPRTKGGKIAAGKLVLLSLVLAYFVQNLFVFDTLNTYLMFFSLLAFVEWQRREDLSGGNGQLTRPINPLVAKLAIPAAVLLLLPAVYFFNLRPALSNHYAVQALVFQKADPSKSKEYFARVFEYSPPGDYELRFMLLQHARESLGKNGLNEQTAPLVELAVAEAKKSIKAAPQFVPNFLLLGELYLFLASSNNEALSEAEEIALQALQEAPRRYQTYHFLGRVKMSQGKFAEGIEYFRQAVALNDKFAEARWNLAVAYILSGQAELAQTELNRTFELGFNIYDPDNIDKLLQAYRDSRDLQATINFLKDLVVKFPDNKNYQQELAELQKLLEQVLEAAGR